MAISTSRSRLTVASSPVHDVLGELEDAFASGLGPLIGLDIGEDILECPVALQQLTGRLVADPGDPRDVVRGIPLQAVEVGNRPGGMP